MPRNIPIIKPLEDLPDCRSVRIAKANLSVCRCLVAWEEFVHLFNEGKNAELAIIRLRYCVEEQCWDSGDLNFQLSEMINLLPVPSLSVLISKTNYVIQGITTTMYMLKLMSSAVPLRTGTDYVFLRQKIDLNTVFRVTNDLMGEIETLGKATISVEIIDLIRDSRWQSMVDPAKVCNLTTNEISS